MKLHNIKMNMKADPMYKNFRHDITPEGLDGSPTPLG
jgi:hypothetical protein